MPEKALDLFEKMHLQINSVIYIIVFNACAQMVNDRAIKIGKKILDNLPNNYYDDSVLLTSATDMLMKFGDTESAERIFSLIKNKNIISYGVLMNGFNINREPWKCLKILEIMKEKNIIPNEIIWNILIGACSKIGMIRRSQYIINQMPLHIQNEKQIQNSLIHMWVRIIVDFLQLTYSICHLGQMWFD